MCPFESPDGASIGYLKNFAIMTQITAGSDPNIIIQILEELDVIPLHMMSHIVAMHNNTIRVFINGTWYGITTNPYVLVKVLRLYRRNGLINPFISISWNIRDNEIRIQTEPGRPCRPLLIVENNEILLSKVATNSKTTWFDLLYGSLIPDKDRTEYKYYKDDYISPEHFGNLKGKDEHELIKQLEKTQAVVEYLDIEEENTMYVAMNKDTITSFHTHVEIHPSTAFSIVTQIVPFANHNQAPRVIFHAAQSKQALGIYTTNFNNRFDTASYIHHYPQKRIIGTKGGHYNGNDRMPNGANVIVAIQTFSGFNQEDSIMINKSSVDRGLFHVTAYKTLTAVEKTLNANEKVMFANPIIMRDSGQVIQNIKHADYTLLNENGIIKEESYIPRGQEAILLGMVHVRDNVKEVQRGVLIEKQVEKEYRDISLKTDVHYYGKIDRVFTGHQIPGNPNRICKVRFRKIRKPEFGDKCCSSHGQKGVVGMIISQENMPFTKDGIVPDIIINPHAFPSRMTMGHIMETIFSKLCCLEGSRGDGTVFMPFDKEGVFSTLEEKGFDKYGNEILYNGRTGEQIKTEIFIGPIYYYRLKHMVTDKIHSRSTGAKVQLTHQPTSGRSAGGGLRIGEMERDVLLSHGLSQFAKECMMEKSDSYRWGVCRHCGILANYAPKRNIIECLNCGLQDISVIETPYAFKLLIQEMEAMGIQIRLSNESLNEQIDEENDEFNYSELYNYIEKEKAEKKKPTRKTKTKKESESETESEVEDTDLSKESEEVSESDESVLEGGNKEIDHKNDKENSKNIDKILDLDLDTDGIYDDMNGGEIPTIVSDASVPFNNLSEEDDNTSLKLLQEQRNKTKLNELTMDENNLLNKNKNLDNEAKILNDMNQIGITTEALEFKQPDISIATAKMPGGNDKSDLKVITLNMGHRLPEPKNKEGGENIDNDDDDFFTD